MKTTKQWVSLVLALGLMSSTSWASSTRTIDADALKSSDHTKTFSLPAATSTLQGDVVAEVPSGTVNGSNTSFTLASTPAATTTVNLSLDGILMDAGGGNDYTISGTTITMATAPASGQKLRAVYHKN